MNKDDTGAIHTMFVDFKKDVKEDLSEVKNSVDSVQKSVVKMGNDVVRIQTTLNTHGRSIDSLKGKVYSDKHGWSSMIRTAFYILTTVAVIGTGLGAAFFTCSGGKF